MFAKKHFTTEKIPDLTGKVAIVTGGNTGIGYITARELARKNAHVFIASRNKERGEGAVEKIRKETGNNQVEYLYLDLVNLKNVKKSAENFLSKNLPLHLLINNAGIMATPWSLTEDGISDQFGVNHVGHFLFTMTLLAKIEASAPSRIVNVSSKAHEMAPATGIEFEKINQEGAHSTWKRYGTSKLANILFTKSLSKRLEGKEVYVNSIHPGVVDTELSRGPISSYGFIAKVLGAVFSTFFSLSPDDGALTQLYAATSPEIVEKNYRDQYFEPFGNIGKKSAAAQDEEQAEKLWKYTEELIDVKLR
ncbi:6151_t:CDS:2 [Funneliformis caledonium]|uniref:6151_t:CDS:1 n=1 Tax=Funneliformis caledonium TaxID=1117310 RepID=A0A9N9FRM6_9GLOM|nr:6151_t:CDS:2 [Funneliformis caledonium]